MVCHGCYGKGWVDSQWSGPSRCPICQGTGSLGETASNTIGSNCCPDCGGDRNSPPGTGCREGGHYGTSNVGLCSVTPSLSQ